MPCGAGAACPGYKMIKVGISMITLGRTVQSPVTRARNGTAAVFAANGFALASWMSRVPDIKARLDLSPGRLSILLLAIAEIGRAHV